MVKTLKVHSGFNSFSDVINNQSVSFMRNCYGLGAYGDEMNSQELETLLIESTDSGVVTVTMNRPEKNAANAVMWDELRDTWNARR